VARRLVIVRAAAAVPSRLDGIRNKIEPADPVDKDLYELEPEEQGASRRSRPRCRR